MNNPRFLFSKIFLLFFVILLASSCIKNDGSLSGDAKVRIFNTVISDTTKNFYFNNRLFNDLTSVSALATATNSSYFVVDADKEYTIDARNSITARSSDTSIVAKFGLGLNYSIYYTKVNATSGTKAKMVVYQDTVRPNATMAKVMFINMGYTLGSAVQITNRAKTFTDALAYGKKSKYYEFTSIKNNQATMLFNLADSTGVVDSLSFSGLALGKVYTVILEGAANGKLKERLVSNN